MLRLSAKVSADRRENRLDNVSDSSSEQSFKSAVEVQEALLDGREKITEPVALPPIEDSQEAGYSLPSKKRTQRGGRGSKNSAKKPSHQSVQQKNMFESLFSSSLDPESEFTGEEKKSNGHVTDEPVGKSGEPSWYNDRYIPDKSKWVPIETVKRKPMELIPAFDSEFWDEFGNTLRVFGTQENVLKIAKWEKQKPTITSD
jgi:poly(A)-specific ribonuclease